MMAKEFKIVTSKAGPVDFTEQIQALLDEGWEIISSGMVHEAKYKMYHWAHLTHDKPSD